jgi:hypothetical protein
MAQPFNTGRNTMSDSKKPTHRAFTVKTFKDRDGKKKTRWLDIGSVWTHRDGKGFDVTLDALPTDGFLYAKVRNAT